MAVRYDRGDVKQTTTGFQDPRLHICQKQIPIPIPMSYAPQRARQIRGIDLMFEVLVFLFVVFCAVRLVIVLRRRKTGATGGGQVGGEPWYHQPWVEAQKWTKTADPPENGKYATWDEALNRPITDALRFEIEYADRDGVVTERTIRPQMIHIAGDWLYIEAYCETRNGSCCE